MKNILKITILLFSLFGSTLNVHASDTRATLNGDSVMSPGSISAPPIVTSPAGTIEDPLSYSQTIYEYQYGACPSGLVSKAGSSQFMSAIRAITIYYSKTGAELGRSVGGWQDTDEECQGYEERHMVCPVGYRGTITDRRLISTSGPGTYDYGPWYTVQNTCVPDVVILTTPNVNFSPPRSGKSVRAGQSQIYGPHTVSDRGVTMTLTYYVYVMKTGQHYECTGGGGDAGNESCGMVDTYNRFSDLTIQLNVAAYVEVYWDRPYSSFGPKYTNSGGTATWVNVPNNEWTDNPTMFTVRITR